MGYYDEELDGIANSIERKLNKFSRIKNFSLMGLIFCLIVFVYQSIKYPSPPNPPSQITAISLILIFIFLILMSYGENRREKIFNSMNEKIFFYLFFSWRYHNDEKSKEYLKKCIDELETYLDDYKKLAYTEDIYSTFSSLRDTLIHHIYPKLGSSGAFEKQVDLVKYDFRSFQFS